jgi:hypothetical protein
MGWYYLSGLFSGKNGATPLLGLIPFFFIHALAGIQSFVILSQPQCPPITYTGIAIAHVIGVLSGVIGYFGGQSALAAEAAAAAAAAASAIPKNCKPGYTKWVDGKCYLDSVIRTLPTGIDPDQFTNYVRGSENFANMQNGAINAFIYPSSGMTPTTMAEAANATGTPTAMKTAAVDDDTYLVDIYKNGKLVTQSIGESVIG